MAVPDTAEQLAAIWGLPSAAGRREVHVGRSDLARAFARLGFTVGAEIGVWEGRFAETLCRSIPSLHLLCVDSWAPEPNYPHFKNDAVHLDAAYHRARARLATFNVRILRRRSTVAAGEVTDGSLDFVFIDANHSYDAVMADLDAWGPKVRRGGIVAGHDYRDVPAKPFIQVKRAVDDYVLRRQIEGLYALTGDKTPSFAWVVR